jgi:hypothetical protein
MESPFAEKRPFEKLIFPERPLSVVRDQTDMDKGPLQTLERPNTTASVAPTPIVLKYPTAVELAPPAELFDQTPVELVH